MECWIFLSGILSPTELLLWEVPAWCLAQEHSVVCVGTLSQRENMSPNSLAS